MGMKYTIHVCFFFVFVCYLHYIQKLLIKNNESISLSSSKSYMRGEIGYVTEVNLVRNNRNKSLLVCLSEYL